MTEGHKLLGPDHELQLPFQVAGTGLGGRVTEDDVLAAAGKPSASSSPAPTAASGAFMRQAPDMPDGTAPTLQTMCNKYMRAFMGGGFLFARQ